MQTDLVLVLEIKSSRRQLIEVLKDKIELDENYQAILKQMVIITFNVSQLVNLKELLPQIPAANLNTSSKNSFASNLESMGLYNCLFDTNLSSANVEFNEQYLRDRGIIGWFWTYQSSNDVLLAMSTVAGVRPVAANLSISLPLFVPHSRSAPRYSSEKKESEKRSLCSVSVCV